MRKNHEERKNDFLDAADRLFAEKGYDNTSTNDILDSVGISRGAMYHHFKSKEEIMDCLIERYSTMALDTMKAVADDRSLSVKEKLIKAFIGVNIDGMGGTEIMRQVHKPQNALMHEKMQRATVNGAPPILAEIIREGIEQGIFRTEHPYECMEIMITYSNAIFDREIVELTPEEKLIRMQVFISNMEKLLGAEAGSLKEVADAFGQALAAGRRADE